MPMGRAMCRAGHQKLTSQDEAEEAQLSAGMRDVDLLFNDDDSTGGNRGNRFHGIDDLIWWHSQIALGKPSAFRVKMVRIVDSRKFEAVILVAILANA
eukprot:gene44459-45811_t